jgi:hypothetical protein
MILEGGGVAAALGTDVLILLPDRHVELNYQFINWD